MWIYIVHIIKLTSNALVTLILTEKDCQCYMLYLCIHLAVARKAWWPYVLSWQHGTMSRCRLAERSQCRDATLMAGLMWSARYRGTFPCRQRYVIRPSLKVALSGTTGQCSLSCRSVDRPRSNFHMSLTTRVAALSNRCMIVFEATA